MSRLNKFILNKISKYNAIGKNFAKSKNFIQRFYIKYKKTHKIFYKDINL